MLIRQQKFAMILCAFVFFAMKTNAQDHSAKHWYALVQQGVVFNNSKVNIQPGLAAGWQFKGYGIGLAGGIDFLDVRSIQSAIDLRKTIKLGKQSVAVFVSPGFNHVIPTKNEKREAGWYSLDHQFENGHYLEAGAGILMGKKKNLLAAFYWSRKTYEETFTSFLWNPVLSKIEEVSFNNKYEYNRLGIKLAFCFN